MKKVFLLILFCLLLYLPSLNVFFSGDDFFHLRISQIDNFGDFPSFFSFEKNVHSASFYRPLTTQVFFFLGQKIFGLAPAGYHVVSLVFFAVLLFLVYLLAKRLFKDEKIALLSLFFYSFSISHFAQVYYLSAFQELGMAVFYFAGLLFWLKFLESGKRKYYFFTLLSVVCCLLSKETAVTFPLVAGLLAIYLKKQRQIFSLWPLLLIEVVYLYFRLFRFGGVAGESYVWDFSGKFFNTLGWYLAWALGIPEMFLDFIGPKLAISPKLLLYYPWQTKIILFSFGIFIFSCLAVLLKERKKDIFFYVLCCLLYVVALLPVLFLPWHKFPLELTVPLLAVALFLGRLFGKAGRMIIVFGLIFFSILNITSYLLTYQTHWVIRRGEVAQKVISYFAEEYPAFPRGKEVYFYNDSAFITEGWGASQHISVALSGSDALAVFYHDPKIKVYYQDLDGEQKGENLIRLGTKEFLGY